MKRIVSLFLALVLVIGMIPVQANAAELDNGLQYVVCEDHAEITGYTGDDRNVVIPAKIEGKPVTVIGNSAFKENQTLNSVSIPNSVTSIGDSAFYHCRSLYNLTLPSSLTSIGHSAFQFCFSLNNLSIPDSVTFIGEAAFRCCDNFTSITIPDGITSIGSWTFAECLRLSSVVIPDSVTSIGEYAFYQSTALSDISIPDSVTTIDAAAFSGCTRLTEVTIPDSVTSIGGGAFSNCTGLASVTLPDSIDQIVNDTFSGCSSLTGITIPDSVTSIGSSAFNQCTSLAKVSMSDCVTYIGVNAFRNCDSLTSICIQNCTTSIHEYAFADCDSLTEIHVETYNPGYSNDDRGVLFDKTKTTLIQAPGAIEGSYEIPEGVTYIQNYAFLNCSRLTSVSIPESVAYLHNSFIDCTALTSITFCGDAPKFDTQTFYNVTATVCYPAGNPTWTEEVMQSYGGEITWLAVDLPHAHEYSGVVTAPTCLDQGFTTYTCQCGHQYQDDHTDALGHDFAGSICTRCQYDNGFQYTFYWNRAELSGYTGTGTEIVIPAQTEGLPVTAIDKFAFSAFSFPNCKNLVSVVIPASVTDIYTRAFSECSNLTSIYFEGHAPYFGSKYGEDEPYNIFYGVTATAYYPAGDTTWVDYKLVDHDGDITWVAYDPSHPHEFETVVTDPTCTGKGFTTYTCPCGYQHMTDYVDALGHDYEGDICTRCSFFNGLQYTVHKDHVEITRYSGTAREIVIPAQIEGLPVTAIGNTAFYNRTSLTSVTIPEGVTSIGMRAFYYCNKLTSMIIPASVTEIDDDAFMDCHSMTSILFKGDAPQFGNTVFSYVTATAYYPADNATWTEDVMHNYSGKITWVAHAPSHSTTTIVTDPTCTNQGFTTCVCECGYSYVTGYSDALGHDYADHICIRCGLLDNGLLFEDCADHVEITGYAGSAAEVVIPAELNGKPVTVIRERAFYNCSTLTSIEIPDSVASIGNYAFYNCSGLTAIEIPDGITSIADSVFRGCSGLTAITIPDSVVSIGSSAFSGCSGLTGITIPDSVASISGYAFASCTSLTGITIPDGITSIGDFVFSGCSSLTGITIPDSVTSIGGYAFRNCSGLTSITIPAGVASISSFAFDNCSSLTVIFFQGDAPAFVYSAFNCVTATVCYPAGNPTWTEDVMQNYGGWITWLAVDFPHTHEYSTVVTAPTCTEDGFTTYTCSCRYSYTDDHVDALGHDMSIIETVEAPTCTSDGTESHTCSRCGCSETHTAAATGHSYTAVVTAPTCIEDGFTTYTCVCGDSYLADYVDAQDHDYSDVICSRCGTLTNGLWYEYHRDHVVITGYSGDATELVIPAEVKGKPVTEIGKSAFSFCEDLTSIVLPDGITSIGTYAFQFCYNLTSINIPDSVTSIGGAAFDDCRSLTSIVLPDGITAIADWTFRGCNNLSSIVIPDSVSYIGNDAFAHCYILPSIDLPDGVTFIGSFAFAYCHGLTEIDIPEGVTSIEQRAFLSCSGLTSISIPAAVSYIGTSAFCYCENLTSIYFNGDAPAFDRSAFYGVTATACYPAGNPTWTEDVLQDYGGEITWLAHDPSHEYTAVVTDPTCTEDGFTTYTCICGDSYVSDHVDALGHDYAENICTRCGASMENPFSDVPAGSFYEEPVLWALEKGITTGTSENSFSPNDQCLRAHVVTFLWRANGCPEPTTSDNSFTDVKESDFFYKPVLWAVEKGITTGISSTSFGSYGVCNRAQVVTFLWRAAGSPEPQSTDNPFTDVKTTDFFYKPVLWAVENGVTNGLSTTEFGPNAACNRAQVVTFLYRAYTD